MVQRKSFNHIPAQTARTLTGVRRMAVMLLMMLSTTITLYAETKLELTCVVVSDLAADANKVFKFKITLDDTTVNGTYGNMTFDDGVAIVTLKGGESASATGLAKGIDYIIDQDYDVDEFDLTTEGETGTISDNKSTATFTYTRKTSSGSQTTTYGLSTGTSEHGTLSLKVGDNDNATSAAEGAEVIVTVNAATGWQISGVTAEASTTWDQASARRRTGSTSDIPFANITPTKVDGTTNQWKFTMPPANVTVSATYKKVIQASWIQDIAAVTYNGSGQTPTVTVKDGTTTLEKDVDYTVSYTNNVNAALSTATTNAPTVTITAVATSDKYAGTATKTFTINKAALTVKADDKTVTFGDEAPTYSAQFSGFAEGDSKNDLDGALVLTCNYTKGDYATTYAIVPSGLTSRNYNIVFKTGWLAVHPASFNVSFATIGVEKTCGDEPFSNKLTSSMSGTVTYTSSNPSVATIDDKGLVTIHAAGTTLITGSVYVNGNYQREAAYYTVEVAEKILVDEPGMTISFDGHTYKIKIDEDKDVASGQVLPDEICDAHLTYARMLNISGKTAQSIDGESRYLFTVCLPFAPKFRAKYYTLAAVGDGTLQFDEIEGKPNAYTPYLVSIAHNVSVKNVATVVIGISGGDLSEAADEYDGIPYVNDNDISLCGDIAEPAPVDGYQLKGTLRGLTNADAAAEGAYILQSDGRWGVVKAGSADVFIPPFRAYIVGASQNTRSLDSSFGSGTTGIERIVTVDRDGTQRWYDLQGRRIEKPATKGIYIHNGMKVAIK